MSGPLLEYEDENGKVYVLGEILPFKPSAPRGTFDYTLQGVKVKFGWVYDDVARVRALSKADAESLFLSLAKGSHSASARPPTILSDGTTLPARDIQDGIASEQKAL